MKQNLLTIGSKTINRLYLVCGVLLFLALAHDHFELVTYEVPLDYNEAGMLTITGTIAAGGNPYSFENQPTHTSVYPVLYNVVVAPFSLIFGNTLLLHRAIAAFFILASCALCYLITQRETNSPRDSFAVVAIFYAGLLFYSTPIASPNSIGLFLFLSTIFVPWVFKFSNRSLCVALALGILAFYAKQYFVACLGYVALYLFIAESKMKGVIFAVSALCLFLVSIVVVSYTSPYFLDTTIFVMRSSQAWVASNETMFNQLLEYGLICLPILVVLGLQVYVRYFTRVAAPLASDAPNDQRTNQGIIDLANLDAPLLRLKTNYFWVCFACSLAIIILAIGKNPGNHLTYLFQLISPFLLIVTVIGVTRSTKMRWLYQLLLIATFYTHYAMLPHDFSVGEKNWQRLRQVMSGADDIFASTLVLEDVIESGGDTYLNGHTRYFVLAENKPTWLVREDPEKTVTRIWQGHINRIYAKIEAQEFDLIILDQWLFLPVASPSSSTRVDTKALLKKYYQRSEMIKVPLANRLGGGNYAVEVWEPIPESPDIDSPTP